MRRITVLILTILLIVGCVGEKKPTVLISQPSTNKLATADVNNANYLQGYTPAGFWKTNSNTQLTTDVNIITFPYSVNFGDLDNGLTFSLTDVGGKTTLRPYAGGDADVAFCGGGTMYCSGETDVAVEDGGTGRSSWTPSRIIYASALTTLSQIANGNTGTILRSQGASSVPAFTTATYPTTAINGEIMFATATNVYGTSPNFNIASTTGILTVNGTRPSLILTDSTTGESDYSFTVDGNVLTINGGTGNLGIAINGNTGIVNLDPSSYAGIINYYTGTAYGVLFAANKNDKIGFYNGTTPVVQPISTRPIDLLLQDLGLRGAGTADANFDRNMLMQVPYGAAWMEDGYATVVIPSTSTYVDLNAKDLNADQNNTVFFKTSDTNGLKLSPNYRGRYLVNWSATIEVASNAQEVEGAVCANDAAKLYLTTANMTLTGNAGQEQSLGGTGVIEINDGDIIDLCFENESGTNNVIVTHANISLMRIWRHTR